MSSLLRDLLSTVFWFVLLLLSGKCFLDTGSLSDLQFVNTFSQLSDFVKTNLPSFPQ